MVHFLFKVNTVPMRSCQIPMVRGVTSDLQTNRIAVIHKRLASVQRTEHLVRCASSLFGFTCVMTVFNFGDQVLPFLVEDCRRGMEQWGRSGTFDPFVKIYEVRPFPN